MSVVKPKPKQLLWPITTDADNPMNQSELEENTCSRCQARENACEQVTMTVTIGFSFALLCFAWLVEKVARNVLANHRA